MSYRQHIAVVNTKKAAAARLLPYQHFIIPDFDRSQHPEMTDEEADSAEFEVMEAQNAKTEFYNIINDYAVKTDFTIGTLNIPNDIGSPFYLQKDVQELFEHYNPRVLDRDDFARVIDIMRQFILDYYTNLVSKPDCWEAAIRDKQDTWKAPYITPYNLDTKRDGMVNSFDAEYQIWDMIRIFREVQWDTETVIFFGW